MTQQRADAAHPPYRTLLHESRAEIEIKRSRFLCTLTPASSVEAARAAVAAERAAHPRARHHCSAWILGAGPSSARHTSDDGEPSGTAGAPMAEALASAELRDVVAVVTRYFGGVLLGAGGLTRAYRAAVAAALARADVVTMRWREHAVIRCDYAQAPVIESMVRSRGWTLLDASYEEGVTVTAAVPPEAWTTLASSVAEVSRATARLSHGGGGYSPG